MNLRVFSVVAVFVSFCVPTFGQTLGDRENTARARVIVTDNVSSAETVSTPTPTPRKVLVITNAPDDTEEGTSRYDSAVRADRRSAESAPPRPLKYGEIRDLISEAKRQMRVSPLRISLNDENQTTEIVRIAFFDWKQNAIDYVVVPKTEFLSKTTQSIHKTEAGNTVRVQTIRGNGVNTPVFIYDMDNQAQVPLIVQYPIEKNGKFAEMAFYVSTHPGVVTPDTVNAGRIYVRSILNSARQKLRQKGIAVQGRVVDIAERLALVEHVDHWRFRNEHHPNIYNDVYALYALNQGQTYRYSVSSAGAGGMVQMIPWTYRMIRSKYPAVGLIPDFVDGMRNHVNAAQAMLLYMQMTWDDLAVNDTVTQAMGDGIATQEQLMAAGYNSNPARLPGYIKRGGENWTTLIPRETKVYLQIYESVERYVPFRARSK